MTTPAKPPLIPPFATSDIRKTPSDFAKLLRHRRERAGLSRLRLAQLAELSEATIKFIELGKTSPSRRTLLRLLLVPGLGLVNDDLPIPRRELPAGTYATPRSPANCYIAPDFEPLRYVEDLEQTLRGFGGQIEQSNLYLTPQSALAYLCYLRKSPSEQRRRAHIPLGEIMDGLRGALQLRGLTVIALGSGDGYIEVRLVQQLLALRQQPLSLWLLDLSEALLAIAFRRAGSVLGSSISERLGVLADFHHLPRYTELFAPTLDQGRQRLFVLLGTLGQLDHTLRFLREVLGKVARSDDLLILDAELSTTPPGEASREPRLSPLEQPDLRDWLCETLMLVRPLPQQITVEQTQERDTLPDDSVTRNIIATVETRGLPPRQFSLLRQHRFRIDGLRALLTQSGFVPLKTALWTDAERGTAALLLCRKTQPTAMP